MKNSTGQNNAPTIQWETIQIFISSTFRDFYAERDYLVKHIFPEIREWCSQWKFFVVDIDLRWGISKEEAQSGKVVEICLDYIDKSRPFFICMLGNRYGWIPDQNEIPIKTLKKYGTPSRDYSVTHMEIFHALLNPEKLIEEDHEAFFYFRSNDSYPAENELSEYSDDEKWLFFDAFFEKDLSKQKKLDDLKDEIKQCFITRTDGSKKPDAWKKRLYHYKPYFDKKLINPENEHLRGRFTSESLSDFGQRVKTDIINSIRNRYRHRIHELEKLRKQETKDNESYLHDIFSRKKTEFFVGKTTMLDKLYSYITSKTNQILFLYGESGFGKSALLSKFYLTYVNNDNFFIIPHFVGASSDSGDLYSMIRRLCTLIIEYFDFDEDIPGELHELTAKLNMLLKAATSPIVLIIDGVNRLDQTKNSHQLYWLPFQLHENVKIIVSTSEKMLKETHRDQTGYKLEMEQLNDYEINKIIRQVPTVFCKKLEEKHIKVLTQRKEIKNPLYLQVALEELRIFGSFEKLKNKISSLPETINALFASMIERLEIEHGDSLVKHCFCLLECSRYGLTEKELSELTLSINGENACQGIIRQIRNYLYNNGIVLGFAHEALSNAVQIKYLQNKTSRLRWHKVLAEYFANQSLYDGFKQANQRKAVELPWQQSCAEQWHGLKDTLCKFPFLEMKIKSRGVIELQSDYSYSLATCENLSVSRTLTMWQEEIQHEFETLINKPDLCVQQLSNRIKFRTKDVSFKEIELFKKKLLKHDRIFIEQNKTPRITNSIHLKSISIDSLVTSCAWGIEKDLLLCGTNDGDLISVAWDTNKIVRRIQRHPGAVDKIAYSNDKHFLATSSSECSSLNIYRSHSLFFEKIITTEGNVRDMSWSPDNLSICTIQGILGHPVVIYNFESGEIIHKIHYDRFHHKFPSRCFWMHNTNHIVIVAQGYLFIYKFSLAGNLSLQKEIKICIEKISSVSHPSKKDKILLGTESNRIFIFDLIKMEKTEIRNNHEQEISSISWSKDEKYFLSTDYNGVTIFWDNNELEPLEEFNHHGEAVSSHSWSPSNNMFITAGFDTQIQLFSTKPTENISFIYHKKGVTCSDWSPDGQKYITGGRDHLVCLWKRGQETIFKELTGHEHHVTNCNWSPDGNKFVSAGKNGQLIIWNSKGRIKKSWFAHNKPIISCCWSQNGKFLFSIDTSGRIKRWKSSNGKQIPVAFDNKYNVTAITVVKNQIILFDQTSKNIFFISDSTHQLDTPIDFVQSFFLSENKKKLIAIGKYDFLIVDDPFNTPQMREVEGNGYLISSCDVDHSGKYMAIAAYDQSLTLWDLNAMKPVGQFISNGNIQTCRFSPNGDLILCGDDLGNVYLLNPYGFKNTKKKKENRNFLVKWFLSS